MFALALNASAQPVKNFFRSDEPVVWIGIDFSEMRYFGDPGTVSPAEMKRLSHAINELVVYEPERYAIGKALRKKFLVNDLSVTAAVNDRMDESRIMTVSADSLRRLSKDHIIGMVKQYEFKQNYGFAFAMFMEGMDKTKEEATLWVAVIRNKDKEVLIAQRLKGKAAGISFRNHWARPVLEVLEEIRKTEYGRWKKDLKG
jgi:hypothetical protein